jgi:hypothetical protein
MNKPAIITALEQSARRRRFAAFSHLFATIACVERPTKILDVGGTWNYWRQMNWTALGNFEVVLLNVVAQDGLPASFKSVVADGRNLSDYGSQEFDVVYSNSAIGHVGTFADQERMAKEIRRVGRSYFLQTPNQRFIIDWRTLMPCFHFLPITYQAWCLRHFRVGTYPRVDDYSSALHLAGRVRNVTFKELQRLFPGGTIVRERVMRLTKSFVVHAGFRKGERDDSRQVAL